MKVLTVVPRSLKDKVLKTIARFLDEGLIADPKTPGDYRLHTGLAGDMADLAEKMATAVAASVKEFESLGEAAPVVREGRMKIERVQLLELDVFAERERIERNFRGADRKLLRELLEAFIAVEWDRAHQLLSGMQRAQLEYVHPVIYEVMRERIDRNNLRTLTGKRAVKVSPVQKLMGGTNGGLCSRDGLDYPKFKVSEHVL